MVKCFGPTTRLWLLDMLNDCLKQQQIPNEWRKAKVVALLKPGKIPEIPKSYRPIALLCPLYMVLARMILTRLQCKIEHKLIPQQAGFRPGKSCCSQVLNLTQHIEDGFELGQITGPALVDLTAAYDTINHWRLLAKLVMLTDDVPLTKFIETMLSNRRFKVQLTGKQSRWRNQRNGLPQGSVLCPLLLNVYTNDQPLSVTTNSLETTSRGSYMGRTGRVPPHHEDDGDSTMSLRGGVLLSCQGPFHASQAHRHNS